MKNQVLAILTAGFLIMPVAGVMAQTHLFVKLNAGSIQTYPLDQIRSLRFGNASMTINFLAASSVAYTTSEVTEYYFGNATGTQDVFSSDAFTATIFPNPATDQIGIQYTSLNLERISICMHDATGKIICHIFEGEHQGKRVYNKPLNIPAGLYFCRITTNDKSISQPVVIQ